MNETDAPFESPFANGLAKDVPVLGTVPVEAAPAKPKRKRRTKKQMAAARANAARRAKTIDPLLAEHQASTASAATTAEDASMAPRPVEEAPAPSHREQGVGAAIPVRSFERRGFVSGLKHMTGFDRPVRAHIVEPRDPHGAALIAPRVPAFVKIAVAAMIVTAALGAALPWM